MNSRVVVQYCYNLFSRTYICTSIHPYVLMKAISYIRKVDGGWSVWGSRGTCFPTCGDGMRPLQNVRQSPIQPWRGRLPSNYGGDVCHPTMEGTSAIQPWRGRLPSNHGGDVCHPTMEGTSAIQPCLPWTTTLNKRVLDKKHANVRGCLFCFC